MRHMQRSSVAVLLVLVLAMPAGAAGRPSSRPGSFVQSVKRFVVRAFSRISPPIGSPASAPEDPTNTTEEPVKTQQTP